MGRNAAPGYILAAPKPSLNSPRHAPPHHLQVRTALGEKVSKERVGAELDGMFNGESPPHPPHPPPFLPRTKKMIRLGIK